MVSTFSFPLHSLSTESRLGWNAGAADGNGSPFLKRFIADNENPLIRHWCSDPFPFEQPIWPIVLYGPSGVGKTSLAETLAFQLVRQGYRASKLAASDFRRLFLHDLSLKAMASFRERFRQLDVIVLDDLKGLGGDFACQRELLQLWDRCAFDDSLHPIRWIVTSLSPPWSCESLCPELKSRLSQGLSIPVKAPGNAARREIISQLCEKVDIRLEPPALDWLVQQLPTIPALIQRDIARIAIRLTHETSERISLALLRQCQEKEAETTDSPRDIQQIIQLAARQFGLSAAMLKKPSRRQVVVKARSLAVYLLRTRYPLLSFSKIGSYFGGRDPSTIRHAYRSIKSELLTDHQLVQQIDKINRQLELRSNQKLGLNPTQPARDNLSVYCA